MPSSASSAPGGVAADAVHDDRQEAICELVGVPIGREPGVCPVRGGEDEQHRRARVEVGAQTAGLDAFLEEPPPPLLVAPALLADLLPIAVLEVSPLAGEDRREVELLRDDAKVSP